MAAPAAAAAVATERTTWGARAAARKARGAAGEVRREAAPLASPVTWLWPPPFTLRITARTAASGKRPAASASRTRQLRRGCPAAVASAPARRLVPCTAAASAAPAVAFVALKEIAQAA